jgi:hypothetical protein
MVRNDQMNGQQSWVSWFVETPHGSIFVPIDREYLENNYNFYGLRQKVFPRTDPRALHPQRPEPPDWPPDIDDFGLCLFEFLHVRPGSA